MQTWKKQFLHLALVCVCSLMLPGVILRAAAQQTDISTSSSRESNSASDSNLPDSPGATLAKMEASVQQGTVLAASAEQSSSSAGSSAQTAPQKPVGTATAEAPDTTGIAASQPAGAAIAPAKQRRVRMIVIKVGAIIGVAAAVGTVVALSEATGSKPPGAH
jgi:cytoskeletal protein RodZ